MSRAKETWIQVQRIQTKLAIKKLTAGASLEMKVKRPPGSEKEAPTTGAETVTETALKPDW